MIKRFQTLYGGYHSRIMGLFKLFYTSVKVSVAVNVEPPTPLRNPEPLSVSLTRPQGVCDSIPWSCRILSGGGPCHLSWLKNMDGSFGCRQSKHPSILQDQPAKTGDTNMIVGPYASYLPSILLVVIRRRVRNRPRT